MMDEPPAQPRARQVAADMLLLVTTVAMSVRYGLAADAFLDVVQNTNGIGASSSDAATKKMGGLFDSTRAAASALTAAGALDVAMRTLQERAAAAPAAPDTAVNLASYFLLRAAEEERGFRPDALVLSERDALGAARAFDAYDANGDGAIDANEMRALMCVTHACC
jgi:hypothetical protein